MTVADAPAPPASLADHVREKLAGPSPVTLADLKKGRKAPPKKSGQTLDGLVLEAVGEAERDGRAYAHPSGKGGATRYWHRDEAEAVRPAVLAAAAEPRTLAELVKAAKADLKSEPGFVEPLVWGLIGEGRLFEHPAKTKAGGPRFGVSAPPPPPHPLDAKKVQTDLAKLVAAFARLQAKAGVSADELLAAVRRRLGGADSSPEPVALPAPPRPVADLPLADLILTAVENAGPGSVLSLADVRAAMPAGRRGSEFDAAVFELDDAGKVRIYQDGDPAALSPAERAELVTDDHGHVFRTIKRAQL